MDFSLLVSLASVMGRRMSRRGSTANHAMRTQLRVRDQHKTERNLSAAEDER